MDAGVQDDEPEQKQDSQHASTAPKTMKSQKTPAQKHQKACWVEEWVMLRDLLGPHETLMSILQRTDVDTYHSYLPTY